MLVLIVFLGGAIGATARFTIAAAIYGRTTAFPWATLVVNAIGSLLLGAAIPLLPALSASSGTQTFLTVGILGAFTTFSTFASDAVALVTRERRLGAAASYLGGMLILGLAAFGMGLFVGTAIARTVGGG